MRLDPFRAPLTEAELARRRRSKLSARQEAHLTRYGYPYVLDQFRFHLTLTGAIEDGGPIAEALKARTEAFTRDPFEIRELCLFGEHEDGRFRIVERFPLSAKSVE